MYNPSNPEHTSRSYGGGVKTTALDRTLIEQELGSDIAAVRVVIRIMEALELSNAEVQFYDDLVHYEDELRQHLADPLFAPDGNVSADDLADDDFWGVA